MKLNHIKPYFISFLVIFFIGQDFNTYSRATLTSANQKEIIYEVKSGDTWYGIARKFSITYPELKLANKNIEKLFPGQKITIPSTRIKSNDPYFEKKKIETVTPGENEHIVKNSETLYGIAKKYGISVEKLKELNGLKSNSIKPGQKLYTSAGGNKPIKVYEKEKINQQKPPIDEKENKQHSKDKEFKEEKLNSENNAPKSESIPDDKIIFSNDRVEVNEKGKAAFFDADENETNKYYGYHKTAPLGTVIQVTNLLNAKTIYVKITGQLSETPENEKFLIKISKASAEKLGVIDKEFDVDLLYGVSKK